jgi:hypothetical protein
MLTSVNVSKYFGLSTLPSSEISWFLITYVKTVRGRDSSVGIATHYGLDGPGIESRWGAAGAWC